MRTRSSGYTNFIKDYQGAINTLTTLTKAIRLDPKFAEAYSRRGVAYREIENNQKAIDDLQKSAKLFATQVNNSGSETLLIS